ncbi:MAG: hypothetical protein RLY78_942 [Pseudomonadota bacterium]
MDQSQDRSDEGRARERLSALLDGDSAALVALGRAPRTAGVAPTVFDDVVDSRGLDADWHLYHLIGDVMRSDDLASTADHDRAFLQGFRQRMAAEPVVLAPLAAGTLADAVGSVQVADLPVVAPVAAHQAQAAVARRRRSWLVAPAAAAAGFVAVAGMVVMLRGQGADEAPASAATLASASPALSSAVVPASVVVAAVPGASGVVTGAMLRDSRIDRYLSAHRKVSSGAAVALPGSTLRQVDVVVQGQQP